MRGGGPILVLAGVLVAVVAPSAWAGTVEGPDLWVLAPDHAHETAVAVRDAFPRHLGAIERWLGVETEGHVQIHLVEGREAMQVVLGRWVGEWHVGGCSPPGTMAIRLDLLGSAPGSTLHGILAHETVHHVLSQLPRPAPPRWFEEGLATYRAGGLSVSQRAWLERNWLLEHLPPLASFEPAEDGSIDDAAGLVYVTGLCAVEHLVALRGQGGLRGLVARLGRGEPFDTAFRDAVGMDVAEFESRWRRGLAERGHGASGILPALLVFVAALFAATAQGVRAMRARAAS